MAKVDRKALCPKCGARMRSRHKRSDRSRFLGCSRWPSCDGTGEWTPVRQKNHNGTKDITCRQTGEKLQICQKCGLVVLGNVPLEPGEACAACQVGYDPVTRTVRMS